MFKIQNTILLVLLTIISTFSFASSEKDNPFRKVARDVTPVVVQIDTVYTTKVRTGSSTFDFFFKNRGEENNDEPEFREYESKGLGSGVVVEARGKKKYVLTNQHVVKDANELTIHYKNGKSYDAKLVGSDERKDLALVVFETKDDIPVATLGDSNDLFIGDWAIAIGSPLGFESSVTLGIISAIGRSSGMTGMAADFTDYIQTDAAINQGNSGGALVNIDGEIIGINTWIASQTGGSIGLGFAIPINNAKKVISDLIDKGSVEYGWLGVSMGPIPKEYTDEDKSLEGAFIYNLFKDSPAQKGQIKAGDIVIGINNINIKTSDDLLKVVGNLPAGKVALFNLIREGKELELKVYPELRNEESMKPMVWPGISVMTLTKEIIKDYNEKAEDNKLSSFAKGVVVIGVMDTSVAKYTGLQVGDIITHVDGKASKDIKIFYNQIAQSSSEVTLNVIRNSNKIKVILLNE